MFKSLSLIAGAALMLSLNLGAQGDPQPVSPRPAPPAPAPAQMKDARPTAAPAPDEFLKKVSQSNRAEIELGQLAQARSSNAAVKTFAQMLITDHTKSHAEVAAMAQTKKVTLPLDITQPQTASKLQLERTAAGAAFDRAFAALMVTNHTNAIREFEMAAKSTDPEVKTFAEKTLPTLKHHLAEAQKLTK
jgi:putative membrane protein